MAKSAKKTVNPPQHQARQPGRETLMKPQPVSDSGAPLQPKLSGRVALITGGDSGIGKAVAILFAKEGADVAIIYLDETPDAKDTAARVEAYGRQCLLLKADISDEKSCRGAVEKTVKRFGKLNILVNNAAQQYETKDFAELDFKKMRHTFEVNIFSMFYLTRYALKYLKEGDCIINTASVTAYRGSPALIDYSSTKGAIVSFTRSLAANLVEKGIRVNGVAPGPIWTPLIPSSFDAKKVAEFGSDSPMKRPGQPAEVAPAYLFLASDDASYISGQFIHPNGGEIVNG
ncbi:MAG: SDR family oxidoreductase [Chitinophagaceae bacterium]|nr:SDR family oxidoreductase [Chitinophagaceae bacterium]